MKFWKRWKSKHVDTIDLDSFDRIFNETDFEIVQRGNDVHAGGKLMMTQGAVRFATKDGRVVKMLLIGLSNIPANRVEAE